MQQAAMLGDRKAGLVEKPTPKPVEDYVLVKVHVAPMCTEYKMFKDGRKADSLGHEAAGEVVEVAQPGLVKPGDRVAVMPLYACGRCELCLAGDYIHCLTGLSVPPQIGSGTGGATYAQYLLKPDWLLVPIPDGVSYEHGGMACCGIGPTFGAMQKMAVDAFDTVLITGMGPVGLGGVIVGTHRGARVIAAEGHPYRAALARKLGAAEVVDPTDATAALKKILDLTGGGGVDKAVDCSGAPPAQRLLVDATRRKGQVAFVGEGGEFALKISDDMIRKGLVLHGSWHYNLADAPKVMKVIKTSRAKLDLLITHTFPLGRVADAWELQIKGDCGKVLLTPWA